MQETDTRGTKEAVMHKRTETMEDGRRYIIYYTFTGRERPDGAETDKGGEAADV